MNFRYLKIISLAILLLGVRLFYLGADPFPLLPPTVSADEGYWVHHARSLILHHDVPEDQFHEDLTVAPLFFGIEYLAMRLFGVSYVTVRLAPVLLSLIGLWLFFILVRRYRSQKVAVLSTVLLGFNPLLVAMNRVPLPDVASMPFFLFALLAWEKRRAFVFATSLITMLVMKTTNVFIVPAFFVLGLVDWKKKNILPFIKRILLYLSGYAAVIGMIVYAFRDLFIFSYFGSSGRDFLLEPQALLRNVWATLTNPFWGRISVLPLTLAALPGLFTKNRASILGKSIILGGLPLLFLTVNQGSDHRYWYMLVGLGLLAGSALKRCTIAFWLLLLASFSFLKGFSYQLFLDGHGEIRLSVMWLLAIPGALVGWLVLPVVTRKHRLLVAGCVLCGALSLFLVFHPTWTLMKTSRVLAKGGGAGATISGPFSHALSIPTKLYPIYSFENEKRGYRVNEALANRAEIRLVPVAVEHWISSTPDLSQCRLNLYPSFFNGRYQVILAVEPVSICE